MPEHENKALLAGYRALDFTDEKGFMCGKILADMGVDVIKIEQPSGDTARNIGPFYHDTPDPEKSLYWWAYNTGKRGITLNIHTREGQRILKKLVQNSHFLIESFPPGYMASLNMGYPSLRRINPGIIMTSITPFGQTGPYKDWGMADITAMAMGGYMSICGDADRAPVRIGFPQAYLHAGVQAAVGTMIAHYHRETSGEGQHVDCSIQEAIPCLMIEAIRYWEMAKRIIPRGGAFRTEANARVRAIWPCQDGYVLFWIGAGPDFGRTTAGLIRWMEEEGVKVAPILKETDWLSYDRTQASQEEVDDIEEPIGKFFLSRSKNELREQAATRRLLLHPLSSAREVTEDEQLEQREYWVSLQHPELSASVTYPGPWLKLSETPLRFQRRAPLIGEHNTEIYKKELGFSEEQLNRLQQKGVI